MQKPHKKLKLRALAYNITTKKNAFNTNSSVFAALPRRNSTKIQKDFKKIPWFFGLILEVAWFKNFEIFKSRKFENK